MGLAYTALPAAVVDPDGPPDWPDGWEWPDPWDEFDGPWPPNFPYEYGGSYQMAVTVASSFQEDATLSVEAETQTGAGASTSDWEDWIIVITAAIGETTIQLKEGAGDSWANSLQYDVTNYSGAKYGLDKNLYFNVDDYEGQDLVVTCDLVAVSPAIESTGTATVANDYVSVTAPATIYGNTKHELTCDILKSDATDEDEYNGETLVITAAVGENTVQLKKLSGDTFADSISYTISNYTGAKYGIQEDMYFDCDAYAASTVTVTATVQSASTVTGTDTGTAAANNDHLTITVPASIDRWDYFLVEVYVKDALDQTITDESTYGTYSISSSDENDTLSGSTMYTSSGYANDYVFIRDGLGVDTLTITASLAGYTSATSNTITTTDQVPYGMLLRPVDYASLNKGTENNWGTKYNSGGYDQTLWYKYGEHPNWWSENDKYKALYKIYAANGIDIEDQFTDSPTHSDFIGRWSDYWGGFEGMDSQIVRLDDDLVPGKIEVYFSGGSAYNPFDCKIYFMKRTNRTNPTYGDNVAIYSGVPVASSWVTFTKD